MVSVVLGEDVGYILIVPVVLPVVDGLYLLLLLMVSSSYAMPDGSAPIELCATPACWPDALPNGMHPLEGCLLLHARRSPPYCISSLGLAVLHIQQMGPIPVPPSYAHHSYYTREYLLVLLKP